MSWSNHQSAAVIGTANDEKRSGLDALIAGKLFDHLMDDLAIFQAENKHSF
jgi:hypothetical protein